MRFTRPAVSAVLVGAAIASFAATPPAFAASSFLGQFTQVTTLASTVPASKTPLPGDGDVNPYGVAVVKQSIGRLHRGNVLVSNFNASSNAQGTGTTIVEISPSGVVNVFARIPQLPGGTGLTTALAVLPHGFVVVGNLPTSNGMSATATRGSLVILDREGGVVENLTGGDINGPWDLTAVSEGDQAALFFTNVLRGTVAAGGSVVDKGTVVRLELNLSHAYPLVVSNTIIGSGFPERTDPNALVVGPTGVGLAPSGTLYVADTVDNTIRAIPSALTRTNSAGEGQLASSTNAMTSHLNGPLGLTIAPNGDVLTVNGDDGYIVETTPSGTEVDAELIDSSGTPPGSGALFGLAIAPHHAGVYFVDDATNTLDLLGR
jgi:hypothetical protein